MKKREKIYKEKTRRLKYTHTDTHRHIQRERERKRQREREHTATLKLVFVHSQEIDMNFDNSHLIAVFFKGYVLLMTLHIKFI